MAISYRTVSELSKLTGRSRQRIDQLISQGVIPVLWIGKQRVIREDEARKFIERCRELDGHQNLTFPELIDEEAAA